MAKNIFIICYEELALEILNSHLYHLHRQVILYIIWHLFACLDPMNSDLFWKVGLSSVKLIVKKTECVDNFYIQFFSTLVTKNCLYSYGVYQIILMVILIILEIICK